MASRKLKPWQVSLSSLARLRGIGGSRVTRQDKRACPRF